MVAQSDFQGCEIAFDLTVVAGTKEMFLDTLSNLESLPATSVFTLRNETVWNQSLADNKARFEATSGQLDRWGSAAAIEILASMGGAVDLLETSSSGRFVERFIFDKPLESLLRHWNLLSGDLWQSSVWGVNLASPFVLCHFDRQLVEDNKSTISSHLEPKFFESIAKGDNSAIKAYFRWGRNLQEVLLGDFTSGGEGETLFFMPRIASAAVVNGVHLMPEMTDSFSAALEGMHQLEEGKLNTDIELANPVLAVLVKHLEEKHSGGAKFQSELKRFKISERVEEGAKDERVRDLLDPKILAHYQEAPEELIAIALHNASEEV